MKPGLRFCGDVWREGAGSDSQEVPEEQLNCITLVLRWQSYLVTQVSNGCYV